MKSKREEETPIIITSLGNNGNNGNSNNSNNGVGVTMVIIIVIALILLEAAVYFGYKYLNSYEALQSVTKTFIPYIHDAKEPKRFTNLVVQFQNLLKEMNTITVLRFM